MGEIVWYLRTLYRPRTAIRRFLVHQPGTSTLVLLVLAYGLLAYAEEALSGGKPTVLEPAYILIGWLGATVGAHSAGRVLGGKGTLASSAIATGVPFVVPLIFTPISIPLSYLASLQPAVELTNLELALLVAGSLVMAWWAATTIATVSEVHGFGLVKGLTTFAASLVSALILIVFASLVMSIILRPMT